MTLDTLGFYCREIIKLATPILGVRVLHIAVNVIGMLFIARLGQAEVAAGALVTVLSNSIQVIALSPLLATGICISRLLGQGEKAAVGVDLRQGLLMSVVIGLLAALAFVLLPLLMPLLGEPESLQPLTAEYFRAMAWGTVPFLCSACCHQLLFPIGKGRVVLLFSLFNLLGVLLLGYGLIHGLWGFPQLGMRGWAYAVSFMNWLVLLLTLSYLLAARDLWPYRLFARSQLWVPQRLKAFFTLGIPITVQFASELLAFSAVNIMVGWLGVGALSVQQIIIQCATVALMVPMGAGQASTLLISRAVGRSDWAAIRQIGLAATALVSAIMLAIALVYLLLPRTIIDAYLTPDMPDYPHLLTLATSMLAIVAFSQGFDALRNLMLAALRGLPDIWLPMWLNMALLWVFGLPLCYVLAFVFDQGQWGINAGLLITFTLGAVLMLRRFYSRTREWPQVLQPATSRT
ncbi:MATE family efflux transporter [Pseudomonas fontis]|uniref:MATE family efflux transporter n=1 Tax=Pseudomonas fontis TaxID=2942633 RepID=A0ABT5NXW3_9PSED|nr:MATE family efflux transporter [Pseudomonas fontis]MDD0972519.1 MATE family efflux transporter [Pseudomonas fontis]MDD0993043.1 MATE family efflux transporter [Pseudomonas fontis]